MYHVFSVGVELPSAIACVSEEVLKQRTRAQHSSDIRHQRRRLAQIIPARQLQEMLMLLLMVGVV